MTKMVCAIINRDTFLREELQIKHLHNNNDKFVFFLRIISRGLCWSMGHSPVTTLLDTLTTRLKAARTEKKISLQEVFDLTGIHVGRLEAKRANMTVLTLLTLCRLYEVRASDLLLGLEDFLGDPKNV
jgi:DNA-binding Xre family transcriptional regulator